MIPKTSKESSGHIGVDFDQLPDSAHVRARQFIGPLIPISPATWWRYIKAGKAPAPLKLGPRVTAWRVGDIRAWLKQEMA